MQNLIAEKNMKSVKLLGAGKKLLLQSTKVALHRISQVMEGIRNG